VSLRYSIAFTPFGFEQARFSESVRSELLVSSRTMSLGPEEWMETGLSRIVGIYDLGHVRPPVLIIPSFAREKLTVYQGPQQLLMKGIAARVLDSDEM
jgi:hypothetical protein